MEKPHRTQITKCRACGSEHIARELIKKSYYLMNLDQTVDLTYAICVDCHFIFQGEYVGDDFLNNYYKQSPMLRRKEPTKFETDQNARQAEFLTRHFKLEGKSVLEIGAHAGAFLMYINKHFGCDTYFDELSEEARTVLSSQPGLKDARSQKELKVDVVVLRHVLEHINSLNEFLSYVKSILKEDGSMFIEVPDWSWLDGKTDPLIFEHLSQFSTHNLIHLMRKNGWNCEALEKSIHPEDPATPNRVQRLIFKSMNVASLGSEEIKDQFVKFYNENEGIGSIRLDEILKKIGTDKKIALYPASHLTFAALDETKLHEKNLVGMFDIDPKKQGLTIKGVKVMAPEELKKYQPDFIFVFTMGYEHEIRESFDKMGLKAKVVSIIQILANDPILKTI